MNQIDYKKKYNEALERMKSWARGEHPECFTEARKAAEFIFPELAESEDDRIRKEMIELLRKEAKEFPSSVIASNANSWISWLEKQEDIIKHYEDKLDKCACDNFNKGYKKALEKQGEQKPAWTEKDEKFFETALWHISNSMTNGERTNISCGTTDWLKSLKDRIITQSKQCEQKPIIPKFRVGDKVVSVNNRRLTYKILEVGIINELGNPEYKVEIFTDGKQGILNKEHNIQNIEMSRMNEWGELIEQKPVISNDAIREGVSQFGITQHQINWLKKYVDVKQGESYTKKDVDVAYLKTKKELESQGEQKYKFNIGDIISNGEVVYRVENITKNCIGQDCYFLVNVESEKMGMRYLLMSDSRGNTHHVGETTWLCEQVDKSFEKQGEKS